MTSAPAVPEVLFVCVHNAGRSQMAAALLAHHARGTVTVRSAGSEPADSINPAVRQVMAEIGLALDTDGRFWNGVYGGGEVLCWSPDGEVLARIPMPAPNVTSVAFAGPDRDQLLVGTARENLTEEDLDAAPLSGSILRIRTRATGRAAHTFGAPIPERAEPVPVVERAERDETHPAP